MRYVTTRLFVVSLLGGLALRLALLPLPGTGDVQIWKVWSFAAASDVTGMYGVGGTPPEHRVLQWQNLEMTVDYPPLALYELSAVGRLYRAARPSFDDTRLLNASVKIPGLVAECVLLVFLFFVGRREYGESAARWAVLALWLNPAGWLGGAGLGYLDAQMAVPLTVATMLAWRQWPRSSGALTAIAIMTKAQAIFAAPAILAVLFWRSATRVRHSVWYLVAGGATTALLLAPFVWRGAWANFAQAIGRLATHDMLSGQAANIWWIATWILRVNDVWTEWGWWPALTQDVRILAISSAMDIGYPNARTIGLVLVVGAIGWACLRAKRIVTLVDAVALSAWVLYAYALLAAQVHENHLAAAVMLLAPATLDRAYRTVFCLMSSVAAMNMYLFYGLGDGWPPLIARSATVIDATVLLSFVNVAAFVWLTRILIRRTGPLTSD